MTRIEPLTRAACSACLFLLLACIAGSASAAADPPGDGHASAPPGSAAKAAAATRKPQRPPISYNSGASPHEFPSDPRKVTMETRPDGTIIVHMNGQGTESLIAHIGPDGKITYTCTDKAEQAARSVIVEDNVHER